MKRSLSVAVAAVLALVVAVSLIAQAPKGWMVRADRSTSASDPDAAGAIKFVTMGTGFPRHQPAGRGVLESRQHRRPAITRSRARSR